MGSGKSSLGKGLAKKLHFPFIDSDKEIERQEEKSIPELFTDKGEDYFRLLEKQFVQSLSTDKNQIIAVGGGLPCFGENMSNLKKKGVVIYLQRPTGELVNRLTFSKNPRPLLIGKSQEELFQYVKNTLEERELYYLQAHYVVDRSVGTVNKLYDFIQTHLLK